MAQHELEDKIIELDTMAKKSMVTVGSATAAAVSVGFLPIPVADSITLIGIQIGMMVGINTI